MLSGATAQECQFANSASPQAQVRLLLNPASLLLKTPISDNISTSISVNIFFFVAFTFPLLYPTLQLQDLQGTEGRVGKVEAGVLQALTQSSYHRFVLLFSFLFGFYWIICWFDNVRQTNTHSGPILSLLFHYLKYYVQLFVFICAQIS